MEPDYLELADYDIEKMAWVAQNIATFLQRFNSLMFIWAKVAVALLDAEQFAAHRELCAIQPGLLYLDKVRDM